MARNKSFHPSHEPFRDNDKLNATKIHGPFTSLNPTRAHFTLSDTAVDANKPLSTSSQDDSPSSTQRTASTPGPSFLWRSRDNRKGRHALVVPASSSIAMPHRTSHPNEVMRTILKMFTHYPIYDISWLVAYIFTWGSIVWCINGFFNFLPFIRPSSNFDGEILDGGGITAFIGAVLFFECGSILLMFEAVNANRAGCFGWAVEQLIDSKQQHEGASSRVQMMTPRKDACTHHHRNTRNFVGKGAVVDGAHDGMEKGEEESTGSSDGARSWQWFPTKQQLKEHYFHEIGFIASFSQFCGATIFSIAGVTALPGIINHMSQGLEDGIYWAPQIVGGSGFIISGTLYMLETQKNWYTPAFGVLGWHIAFWNWIGGIGFTLSGALGPAFGNHGAQYQASCATFWGSFAFLIGSLLQLYESLQKHPVEVVKDGKET